MRLMIGSPHVASRVSMLHDGRTSRHGAARRFVALTLARDLLPLEQRDRLETERDEIAIQRR